MILTNEHMVHLREWGSDQAYPLPAIDSEDISCELRPAGAESITLSAKHGRWWTQSGCALASELRVGGTTLIAESAREIQLRAYCQRLLGWSADRLQAVDHALRSLRLARAHRTAVLLQGDGDLTPIALGLHRRVLGGSAPFVMCDPRRLQRSASIRSPANMPSAVAALEAAAGGSLCIRDRRLPRDTNKALRLFVDPSCDVQLYVCVERERRGIELTGIVPLEVPPLRARKSELARIVDEYAKEALTEFEASPDCFTTEDLAWVQRYARSLEDVEKATSRAVALRSAANLARAAAQLGMADVSLRRWLARRPLRELTAGATS